MRLIAASTLALLAAASIAPARTKLVTLPERNDLVVSLENPNAALLSEERDIPLQAGTNSIDFSWKGVSIDQSSVLLELLTHPGEEKTSTRIIATGYPPDEAALTWQIYSPEARTERIRVSYLLSGISQQPSYEFRVNATETAGDFQQYTLLRNVSGEDLRGATLRLRGLPDLDRSLESGESRRLLALRNKELPFEKLYIARPSWQGFLGESGESISLVYEVRNDAASGLGKFTLPVGKMRLYGDDGDGSSIFLGEDILADTAPQEEGQVTLGTVKDIVMRRYLADQKRLNERFTTNRQLSVFDVRRELRYEVENFKDKPTTLRIHEPMMGDWEVTSLTGGTTRTKIESMNELELEIDLPAQQKGAKEAEKVTINLVVTIRNVFPGEL
ncbi:DUF4139 domain-containing protein [bacterium]|nr:DUF4139 domain-containing protein [bacterium]